MHKADNLPPSCAVVMKSESLNLLESSGPVQACNGSALPLLLLSCYFNKFGNFSKAQCQDSLKMMQMY